jgi:tetratricopeptide (TPR) repeat protein
MPEILRQAEGNARLPDSSFIGGPQRKIEYRIRCGLKSGLLGVLATVFLFPFPLLLSAQEANSVRPEGATVRGTVRDMAGKPMGDAQVVLTAESSRPSKQTTTDAAGRFAFPGVAAGAFTITANSGPLRSAAVSLNVSTPGEQPPISLVLSATDARASSSAPRDAGQPMQFSDDPEFSIAAVTDWTAAGGHGSDASLRTSEALTRDAVKLGRQDTKPAATSLPSAAGEAKESESVLRAALEKDPKDFRANQRLGQFYLQAGRYQDAARSLQAAYEADPGNYDNEFDLAQALNMAGDAAQARNHIRRLMAHQQTATLHRIEGELDEKLGEPMSAVHELQKAVSKDPSEDNYFAWGSELLIHRAVWQAKEVFDEGVKRYPQSARMLTARGAAHFAGALYDEAALDLCKASDLNPEIVEPYLFMGKIEVVAPNPLPCVVAKLERFENLQPNSSLASYYYAMALRKQQGQAVDLQTMARVQDLLARAVALDPKCANASLELGNLSAGKKQWEQAISHYLNAIQADPELNEAHYRLGVAYERAGDQAKAAEQFQLHDTIAREQAAEIQRQRKEVKQFLVVLPEQMGHQQAR